MNPLVLQEVARSGGDFQMVLMPAAVKLAHAEPAAILRSLGLPACLPGLEEEADHVGIVVNPWDASAVVDEARSQGIITATAPSCVLSREIGPGHIVRVGHGPALELFVPSSRLVGDRMFSVHVALRVATPADLEASVDILTSGVGSYGARVSPPPFLTGPEDLGDIVMVYLDHPCGARLELVAPA